jgi:hypothetical protein
VELARCGLCLPFLEWRTSNFCCLELEDTIFEAERRHNLYFDANIVEEGQNAIRFVVRLVIARGNNIFWKMADFMCVCVCLRCIDNACFWRRLKGFCLHTISKKIPLEFRGMQGEKFTTECTDDDDRNDDDDQC